MGSRHHRWASALPHAGVAGRAAGAPLAPVADDAVNGAGVLGAILLHLQRRASGTIVRVPSDGSGEGLPATAAAHRALYVGNPLRRLAICDRILAAVLELRKLLAHLLETTDLSLELVDVLATSATQLNLISGAALDAVLRELATGQLRVEGRSQVLVLLQLQRHLPLGAVELCGRSGQRSLLLTELVLVTSNLLLQVVDGLLHGSPALLDPPLQVIPLLLQLRVQCLELRLDVLARRTRGEVAILTVRFLFALLW
mmetsp:Transcript_56611/g.134849  ORF Transcript_56611/g.134849 Transcript_56611/m.134849 type:complete len:256 (+) Transcript_56611:1033-1800(+)